LEVLQANKTSTFSTFGSLEQIRTFTIYCKLCFQILPKDTLPKDSLPKDILPNGHFADGRFAERTFCRTDILPNGQFAERTVWRTDNLPKIEISSEL
jgi:hypothetical protein